METAASSGRLDEMARDANVDLATVRLQLIDRLGVALGRRYVIDGGLLPTI